MSEVKTDSVVNVSGDSDSGIDLSTNDVVAIKTADSERLRVDASGNMLVGTTNTDPAFNNVAGQSMAATGQFQVTRDGGTPALINRKTDEGTLCDLRKDGATIGAIKSRGTNISIVFRTEAQTDGCGLTGSGTSTGAIIPTDGDGDAIDDHIDLGGSTSRFDSLRATDGTIQTSDQNEKQDIASLTAAEITAAKAISKLFKTFKWKSKVAAKGDAARTHSGVIAQEVQTAMSDVGLDASKYAFWCSDTWWQIEETYTNDDGEERTRINTYETADEAPEGSTQRTRLGIRYAELLAFISAATEQRLTDLETRVTALENA